MHPSVRFLRERVFGAWGKRIAIIAGAFFALLLLFVAGYAALFGPAGQDPTTQEFIVSPDESIVAVGSALKDAGLVRYAIIFRIAYAFTSSHKGSVRPGGYELSSSMDAGTVAKVLGAAPYLSWVVIPAGDRKEQIADLLTDTLSWTTEQEQEWLLADDSPIPGVPEGVYYPDTYLIPSDQPPAAVAARLRSRFLEVLAPYATSTAASGFSTDELVTLASLVEREAAKNDKSLVAGILENRLKRGMPLAVDATLQYIEGTEASWWPSPNADDTTSTSTFNTYRFKGLPPHAIAEPSLNSILAVLHPTKTSCLFYIHDANGVIHCSPTYAGQKSNVAKYLK